MHTPDSHLKKIRVTNIISETAEAKTFEIAFLDDWKPRYQAGQFITLVFPTQHGEKRRSYSISSSQALMEPCSFTVQRVENGQFSRYLIDAVSIGDTLFASGINGLFLLPKDINATKQYFFLAAGSGITPCYAMIKTILATGSSRINLIYSSRSITDCIFYTQLNLLLEKHNNRFSIYFLFSDLFDIYRSRLSKWLLQQLLDDNLVVPSTDAYFYTCGPFEYMRMVQISLLERVPAKNIFKENFNSLPVLTIARPPDINAHFVTVLTENGKHIFKVQYPLTILAAAKKNKILLPYSCEAGKCGSCVATCTKGTVWMSHNEVLMEEEVEEGRILTCQAYPINGDVEIFFL